MKHAARCWFVHQWGKWEMYMATVVYFGWLVSDRDIRKKSMQNREQRRCASCGKSQDRQVEGAL